MDYTNIKTNSILVAITSRYLCVFVNDLQKKRYQDILARFEGFQLLAD